MTLGTVLRLGRISNLPTVWTNALAGSVLATGGAIEWYPLLIVALSLSLFYEGGMWLNDAFDAEIDANERANRPIPMGEITRNTVFIGGFVMLAAGIGLAFTLGPAAGAMGCALAVSILLYDWLHKRTVFSPVIMGATRFLSYGLAAVAVGVFAGAALWGALGLFAWIIGLTYAAKQEAYDRIGSAWPLVTLALPIAYAGWVASAAPLALIFWIGLVGVTIFALHRLFRRAAGDVPKAVVTMIAGISLYDAALIGGTGSIGLAAIAGAGFLLTLALQRVASGT